LRAQTRSLHNFAFSLGAALAGLSLAIGDAAMVFTEVLVIRGLPEIRAAGAAAGRRSFTARATCRSSSSTLNAVLGLYITLVPVVVPLWIVGPVAAPAPLISGLLMLNTVLAVRFQVRASAGAETLSGAPCEGQAGGGGSGFRLRDRGFVQRPATQLPDGQQHKAGGHQHHRGHQ
jgi:hypothetical protein